MPKRPLPSNEHAHNEASASASSEMTKKKDILKSKYVGVRAVKDGWSAVINSTVEGKRFRQLIGPFPTEEEAARKYDEVSAARGRPVNFPAFGPGGAEQKRAKKDAASKFLGVCWHKPASRWSASITVLNKNQHLGYFPTEDSAAIAYDQQAGPLGRPVNFPDTAPPPDPKKLDAMRALTKRPGRKKNTSDVVAPPPRIHALADTRFEAMMPFIVPNPNVQNAPSSFAPV